MARGTQNISGWVFCGYVAGLKRLTSTTDFIAQDLGTYDVTRTRWRNQWKTSADHKINLGRKQRQHP